MWLWIFAKNVHWGIEALHLNGWCLSLWCCLYKDSSCPLAMKWLHNWVVHGWTWSETVHWLSRTPCTNTPCNGTPGQSAMLGSCNISPSIRCGTRKEQGRKFCWLSDRFFSALGDGIKKINSSLWSSPHWFGNWQMGHWLKSKCNNLNVT